MGLHEVARVERVHQGMNQREVVGRVRPDDLDPVPVVGAREDLGAVGKLRGGIVARLADVEVGPAQEQAREELVIEGAEARPQELGTTELLEGPDPALQALRPEAVADEEVEVEDAPELLIGGMDDEEGCVVEADMVHQRVKLLNRKVLDEGLRLGEIEDRLELSSGRERGETRGQSARGMRLDERGAPEGIREASGGLETVWAKAWLGGRHSSESGAGRAEAAWQGAPAAKRRGTLRVPGVLNPTQILPRSMIEMTSE